MKKYDSTAKAKKKYNSKFYKLTISITKEDAVLLEEKRQRTNLSKRQLVYKLLKSTILKKEKNNMTTINLNEKTEFMYGCDMGCYSLFTPNCKEGFGFHNGYGDTVAWITIETKDSPVTKRINELVAAKKITTQYDIDYAITGLIKGSLFISETDCIDFDAEKKQWALGKRGRKLDTENTYYAIADDHYCNVSGSIVIVPLSKTNAEQLLRFCSKNNGELYTDKNTEIYATFPKDVMVYDVDGNRH